MAWGALISAALPGMSGALDFASKIYQQEKAQSEASKNRHFQEQMSNTAHQREVDDLRAAGLNPILSATGGSGASTPTGTVAPAYDLLGTVLSSAFAAFKTMAEAQKTQAEAYTESFRPQLLSNQAEKESSAIGLNKALADQAVVETEKKERERDILDMEKKIKAAYADNPDLVRIIRSNASLENALKDADVQAAKREAHRMVQYEKMDKSKLGGLLLLIERLISGYKGRQ